MYKLFHLQILQIELIVVFCDILQCLFYEIKYTYICS
jgi:hypothetical protein